MTSYIHESGNWKYCSNAEAFQRARDGSDLRRELRFKCAKDDAFIKAFDLLGYCGGSIAICINYRGHYSQAPNCFKEQGIDLSSDLFRLERIYKSENIEEVRRLFKIIKELGKIPPPYLETIEKVVAAGKHAIKPDREPEKRNEQDLRNALANIFFLYPK